MTCSSASILVFHTSLTMNFSRFLLTRVVHYHEKGVISLWMIHFTPGRGVSRQLNKLLTISADCCHLMSLEGHHFVMNNSLCLVRGKHCAAFSQSPIQTQVYWQDIYVGSDHTYNFSFNFLRRHLTCFIKCVFKNNCHRMTTPTMNYFVLLYIK